MYTKTAPDLARKLIDRIDEDEMVIDINGLDVSDLKGLLQTFVNKQEVYAVRLAYPDNLYRAIFGYNSDYQDIDTVDQLRGLEYVLSLLDEREQSVINWRYKEGKTQEEIGERLGITGGRARQIEMHALRKLRSPWNRRYIANGYNGEQYRQQQAQQVKMEEIYEGVLEEATTERIEQEKIRREAEAMMTKEKNENEISIEDLGLSTHALHCLKRGYIYTVSDLCKVSDTQLLRIRHLGPKTLGEIAEKVKEKTGIDIWKKWEENR